MPITHQHKDLGEVRGDNHDGVVHFLGVKYASLENRFAAPSLVTDYSSGKIDATKYGYLQPTLY